MRLRSLLMNTNKSPLSTSRPISSFTNALNVLNDFRNESSCAQAARQ
jgi:hypothetical protein